MLFFGHIGITAGAVKACVILLSRARSGNDHLDDEAGSGKDQQGQSPLNHPLNRMGDVPNSVDYRLVLLGSLLPDLIDKPMWLFLHSSAYPSGRSYAHSLLFNLFLLVGGVVLFRYRKPWLLVVSVSSLMHLLLDQMWVSPVVLLWPLLGPLPWRETAGWMANILQALFSETDVYIPEIIGLLIILLFIYRLMKSREINGFIKEGVVA